jgi:hypothetical protein
VFNGSSSDVEFTTLREGRRDVFVVPQGDWVGTARMYRPEKWEFEFKGQGTEKTSGSLPHNYTSDDAFIEIDDKGWQKRGMPAWYFLETRVLPVFVALCVAGVVALIVLVIRREKAKMATH